MAKNKVRPSLRKHRISCSSKLCAWMLGQLMWRFVFKIQVIERAFFNILGYFKKDTLYEKQILGQVLNINPHRSIVDLRLCICGLYEPDVVEYLISRILAGMVVIDIGANIGFFSLLMADLVSPTGEVLCYEPNPTTFEQLKKNIALNPYSNITPIQSAISNTTGTGRMSVLEDSALNTLALVKGGEDIEIPLETLDASLRAHAVSRCDLIKIDIEGAEFLAVQGMKNTITLNPNIEFVIEVHPSQIEQLGGKVQEFLRFFVDLEFTVYKLGFFGKLTPYLPLESKKLPGHIVCRRNAILRDSDGTKAIDYQIG